MGQSVRPVDAGVAIGEVVLGKYRVDAILGSGGMGVVAKCTHLQLNEQVAIKMLRQDILLDADAVQRFTREAQAANKLKSEYVARVHDVGTFANGVPYMVMEFLDGRDLGQMLVEQGPVNWQLAVDLTLQAAEALAEAHSISIVHRDIKPSNLFIGWRPDGMPQIKVLDFGISKSQAGADLSLTQTQSLLGTPAYMSPEQMRSAREVDARSDIWSLGTVLFEIIEGQRPFIADSFSEMCVKVAIDPPGPMSNAPPPLQAIILRCLEKQPERRYANMAELGRDLVPLSRDPHAAIVLVERMQRVLRRSMGEWDSQSTNGGTPIPRSIRDLASGPVQFPDDRTPSPAMGSAALSRAGQYTPATPHPAFQSAAQTTARTAGPGRGKIVWALVLLAAAGVGIGVGVAMSGPTGDGGEPSAHAVVIAPTDAAVAHMTTTPTIAPTPPTAPMTTIDAGTAAIAPTPTTPTPTPIDDAGAGSAVIAPTLANTPNTPTGGSGDQAGSAVPAIHTTVIHHPKPPKQKPAIATEPTSPSPPIPQKPAAPPCNVYDHPNGCPR